MATTLLRATIDGSLVVQWIALLVGIVASSFAPASGSREAPLGVVLWLENIVQVIEIVFYHWYRWVALGSAVVAAGSLDVTWVRYLDRMFTTPVMLISTALFFEWKRGADGSHPDAVEAEDRFSLWDWLSANQTPVVGMVVANGVMLLLGFLQEIGTIDIVTSTVTGFFALGVAFWILGRMRGPSPKRVGAGTGVGVGGAGLLPRGASSADWWSDWLYPAMFFVWSLYGVAATLPSLWKNVMYNILDLFSKNFYGLYVSWLVFQRA